MQTRINICLPILNNFGMLIFLILDNFLKYHTRMVLIKIYFIQNIFNCLEIMYCNISKILQYFNCAVLDVLHILNVRCLSFYILNRNSNISF